MPNTLPMRLFLALELGDAILGELAAAIAPLREAAPELAWTRDEQRHLTLKFFGSVEAERLDGIVLMTESIARIHRPFAMEIGGVGAFPNFRRARVVWVGVEHEARLELLHHDVEVAAAELGFEIEGRAFRPHVTLARIRTPEPEERLRRLARAAKAVDFGASATVAEMVLFESVLAPGGAQYRQVHVAKLGGC